MSVAELGYKIDSSGAVVAAANLDDMTAAAVRAEAGADRMAAGQRKLSAAIGLSSNRMRMIIPQASQVAQQFTATGNLGQAVAVQAADIGLAWGTAGTIIGAVAGIALPALISSMGGGADAAEDMEEQVESLADAVEMYRKASRDAAMSTGSMIEEYGLASEELKLVLQDFAAIEKINAIDNINATTAAINEMVTASGRFDDVSSDFGKATEFLFGTFNALKRDQVAIGVEFARNLDILESSRDAAVRLQAAVDLRQALLDNAGGYEGLNDAQKQLLNDLGATIQQMELFRGAVTTAEGQTFNWASAMASVGDEISAIMSSMSSLTGGVIGNAAKQTEIDALRAGKSIRDAARAATDFKAQTEFDAREQGANMFERLIISGERYQHERGMQLDAELDREREAARERDRITGGGGGGAAGLTSEQYESKLEALRTSLLNEREVLEQWKLEQDTLLADQRAIELLGIEEHNQAKLRLEEEYNQRRVEIAAMGEESKLSLALGGASDVLGVIGQFNDKAFKLAKVAAAAQALISTLQGSAEALKLPFPYNLIAAAQVMAHGMGLVSAIKGVSSSGGSASISAGGTSSAAGVTATSSAAEVAPQTNAIIQVESGRSRFTVEEINDIITGIQSESEDGVIISGIQTA